MENKVGKQVAIVTGSYRGIGLEIVKGISKQFDGDVYITARSVEKCKDAAEKLNKEGYNVCYHQLDIESIESIETFSKFIKETYGGLDILVNNAAILIYASEEVSMYEAAVKSISANYTGLLNVCNAFFPLLRSNARVVHVSSRYGLIGMIKNSSIRKQFLSQDLTVDQIKMLLDEYLSACKDGTWKKKGYPKIPYSMTKIAVNVLTRIQQKEIDNDKSRSGIIVSAMCPGYCKTDMTNHGGLLSAEQGADTAVYLALLPADFSGQRGSFWAERNLIKIDGNMLLQVLPMAKRSLLSLFKKNK